MAAPSKRSEPASAERRPRGARRIWLLVKRTVGATFRYRVTGLAAEAAFFALLSLPPLILGIVGTLGYLKGVIGQDNVIEIRAKLLDFAGKVLAQGTVNDYVKPILDSVLSGGRADVVSVGFLLSLWSGSRAVNVYVDTITIAYGMRGRRGIIRTRALSFSLYLAAIVAGAIALPLALVGPHVAENVIPEGATVVSILYWPVMVVAMVAFLATLYHASVPVRTAWRRALPGAVLALAIWVAGSALLRVYLSTTVSSNSIYGSLGAPIAMLLWGYVTALAVLIGAALNAEFDRLWPIASTLQARDTAVVLRTPIGHDGPVRRADRDTSRDTSRDTPRSAGDTPRGDDHERAGRDGTAEPSRDLGSPAAPYGGSGHDMLASRRSRTTRHRRIGRWGGRSDAL